ncbi:MAG: methyltransferase domain-containing protein [Acidobacteriia bacterium]|nr:methyltransferase domain-containing protein [Terriglobia bacterium]
MKSAKLWPLLLALTSVLPVTAQVAGEANARYQTAEGRNAVAGNLAAPDRDQQQKPRVLVEAMGILPGMTVVDVGTGIGYMLPLLSRAVWPDGKVIAEDIFDDFLSAAKVQAVNQQLGNVVFVKGTDKDPALGTAVADRVLVLDVYHHFDYPEAMLAGIHKALKPDGKLVVVEYYKTAGAMPNGDAVNHIRLNKPEVIKEIEANHFRLVSEREHIRNSQYMLILEKN